jgi:hypothetical protein
MGAHRAVLRMLTTTPVVDSASSRMRPHHDTSIGAAV